MLITGKVLFAFVDPKDPFMPSAVAGEEQLGPILSILSARRFDFLLLFYTPHTRKAAEETRRAVEMRYSACMVMPHEIPVSDPNDCSPLMNNLSLEVRQIVWMSRSTENSVCVSSGTAAMRAAWFLLTAFGVLRATHLQVGSPTQPLLGAANVKEVQTDVWSQELRNLMMSSILTVSASASDRSIGACGDVISPHPVKGIAASHAAHTPLHTQLETALQELGLVVTSAELRLAAERAAMAAPAPVPVLLLGESGTGKELFAKLVHRLSDRSRKPMITVNCSAIPQELAESALFGHTRSAFTGAREETKGIFGDADGGTIFLDEIGELPLTLQPKLLRVLEAGTFTQLGSTKETRVDVRVIAATNRNLTEEIGANRFRNDLYQRLDVARVELPPLRSRRGDILQLAAAFMERINQRRRSPVSLSTDALSRLENYSWPGNARELLHALERAAIFARTPVLGPEDIVIGPPQDAADPLAFLPEPSEGFSMETFLDQVRKQLILRALDRANGNQSQAGKLLGISRQAVSGFCKGEGVNAD